MRGSFPLVRSLVLTLVAIIAWPWGLAFELGQSRPGAQAVPAYDAGISGPLRNALRIKQRRGESNEPTSPALFRDDATDRDEEGEEAFAAQSSLLAGFSESVAVDPLVMPQRQIAGLPIPRRRTPPWFSLRC